MYISIYIYIYVYVCVSVHIYTGRYLLGVIQILAQTIASMRMSVNRIPVLVLYLHELHLSSSHGNIGKNHGDTARYTQCKKGQGRGWNARVEEEVMLNNTAAFRANQMYWTSRAKAARGVKKVSSCLTGTNCDCAARLTLSLSTRLTRHFATANTSLVCMSGTLGFCWSFCPSPSFDSARYPVALDSVTKSVVNVICARHTCSRVYIYIYIYIFSRKLHLALMSRKEKVHMRRHTTARALRCKFLGRLSVIRDSAIVGWAEETFFAICTSCCHN